MALTTTTISWAVLEMDVAPVTYGFTPEDATLIDSRVKLSSQIVVQDVWTVLDDINQWISKDTV